MSLLQPCHCLRLLDLTDQALNISWDYREGSFPLIDKSPGAVVSHVECGGGDWRNGLEQRRETGREEGGGTAGGRHCRQRDRDHTSVVLL